MNNPIKEILTKLENAVEASTIARMNGRTVNNRKIHKTAHQAITEYIENEIERARQEERAKIHTKFQEGDVAGLYKITERFRKIGNNTKFKVVCVFCGQPMSRYSNKFKLPHRGCPATQRIEVNPKSHTTLRILSQPHPKDRKE